MSEVLAELSDTVRPITRREFNAWGAEGWFEDERVELIDGVIVTSARFATITDAVAQADLVIEVAHSSRRRDLVVKPRLYAEAAVPEYWVVDLVQRELVIHTDPQGAGYGSVVVHAEDETVEALGVPIPLRTLFALS